MATYNHTGTLAEPHALTLTDDEVLVLAQALHSVLVALPFRREVAVVLDGIHAAIDPAATWPIYEARASRAASRPIEPGGPSQGTDFETNQEES